MSAEHDLQKGIFDTLVNTSAVTALLGGPYVYDHVPRQAAFPYITFGRIFSGDWSTGTESGREHFLTIHVWSRAGGRKQAQEIADAVNGALHDATIALDAHSLINLRFEAFEVRRDRDGETLHGILRYRAVTEPLN